MCSSGGPAQPAEHRKAAIIGQATSSARLQDLVDEVDQLPTNQAPQVPAKSRRSPGMAPRGLSDVDLGKVGDGVVRSALQSLSRAERS